MRCPKINWQIPFGRRSFGNIQQYFRKSNYTLGFDIHLATAWSALMKLIKFISILTFISILYACGGGGSPSATPERSPDGATSAQGVTFQSTIDVSSVQAILKAPAGLTSETVALNDDRWIDKIFNILGIKTAVAATNNDDILYALKTDDSIYWLNFLQSIATDGTRSNLKFGNTQKNMNGTTPTIKGMHDTPTFGGFKFEAQRALKIDGTHLKVF